MPDTAIAMTLPLEPALSRRPLALRVAQPSAAAVEAPPAERSSTRARVARLRAFTVATMYREKSRRRRGGILVPCLRMTGQWLEQYGFERGARVYVVAEPGRLVITTAAPSPANVSLAPYRSR